MRMPNSVTTPFLMLERWRLDDAPHIAEAANASLAELAHWLPWAAHGPLTSESVTSTIVDAITAFDAGVEHHYVIRDSTGVLLGCVALHVRDRVTAEIGYWVRSDRTGSGVATAAVRSLTGIAFESLPDIDTVHIRMDAANRVSAAVARSAGYTIEHTETRPKVTIGHTGVGQVWIINRER